MQSVVTSPIIAPNSDSLSSSPAKAGRGRPDVDSNDRGTFSELLDSNVDASSADFNTGERPSATGNPALSRDKEAPVMRTLDPTNAKPSPSDAPPVMPTITPGKGDTPSTKSGPPVMPVIDPNLGDTPPATAGPPVMRVLEPVGMTAQSPKSDALVVNTNAAEPSAIATMQTAAAPVAVAGLQPQTTDKNAVLSQTSKLNTKGPIQVQTQTQVQAQVGTANSTPTANNAAQFPSQPEIQAAQASSTPAPILSDGDMPDPGQAVALAAGRKPGSKSNTNNVSTSSFSGPKQTKTAQPNSAASPVTTSNIVKSSVTLPEMVFDPAAVTQKSIPISVTAISTETAQSVPQSFESGQTTNLAAESSALRGEGTASAERSSQAMARFTPRAAAQLAAQITQRFNNGSRVFDIRLDPAELGRVDVRLELMPDQRVHAILTAERGETLAELQRSARDLEQALNDAGLELADSGLEFQLNEDMDQPDLDGDDAAETVSLYNDSDANAVETDTDNQPREAYGFLLARRDSVDLRV